MKRTTEIEVSLAKALTMAPANRQVELEGQQFIVVLRRILKTEGWDSTYECVFQTFEEGAAGHAEVPNGTYRFFYHVPATAAHPNPWDIYGPTDRVKTHLVRPRMTIEFEDVPWT